MFGGSMGLNNDRQLPVFQQAVKAACYELRMFCAAFEKIQTQLGYFDKHTGGLVIPSELGLSDLFITCLGNVCGKSSDLRLEFAGTNDERKGGYDFHWDCVLDGIRYTVYFQAKCAKYTGSQYVQSRPYADFLRQNTQGEKQWRLLRDHVLQESIQHDNDTRRIILGIYIIYDSQMISFVPIGRIHQINMKYDQFAQDASKATNAFVHSLAVLASPSDCTTDVLFQQDKVMDKLAEALRLNKLQPEDVGMSVEGEILS